ncbi:hypothetical protein GH714_029944 [Hevea brasiliensis]|uniref:Sacsin/Nov domain-containing protein n=1 Tax=Hevea brasiliensis TaxID=3981 RepID=A0A6A6LKB7_HEVBR|nr:hypothetical protein GH714_029944 [Hevea brasiliensis]
MELPSRPPESILLEDFGQKVDLTRRIREVLLNYPEGTTVLKELIQNADDAGATKVRLCLDRRHHGSDSLLSNSLSQWQGPALLAYNNAVFTEEDFVSISRIGGSAKNGQAWKTGRFGVGFNSVYHLTDLPSFVSGKYVVLFDPQGAYLPNISTSNPGKRIDFVSSSAIALYKDQFSPYVAFGCDMKTSFAGTLFRFPLRNAHQAATSKLSRQAYFDDDILSMFNQLFEEGVLSLLFLKNVLSIEMYVWDKGENEPRKLYSCGVCVLNDDVIWHRQALLRLSKRSSDGLVEESEMDGYCVDFLSEAFVNDSEAWSGILFLPLPIRTGLKVHVNGYFEVSSNRRGIWYGADMDRSGKVRSIWNRLLLEDVVAPAFRHFAAWCARLLGSIDSYYSLWPTGSFEEPWNILVEHIYRKVGYAPVLHSEFEGGKWVTPVEAFLHDEEFNKSKELGEALLKLGIPYCPFAHCLV